MCCRDFLTEDDVESALLTPGKLSRKASVKYDQSETQQPAAALRKPGAALRSALS
jgi:hypothetical protein